MIQRAKKEVFGPFPDFGLFDRLGNADFDSTKCFPRFGNITRSWRIIQKSKKCLFERPKVPKKRFLAVFWTYVIWIDLILHIMIETNVFQHLAPLQGHEG